MSYYEDIVYETDNTRREPSAEPNCRAPPPLPRENLQVVDNKQPTKKCSIQKLAIAGAVATTIIIVLLVVSLVQFHVFMPKQAEQDPITANNEQSDDPSFDARSCLDLKNRGTTKDGIYEVKPEGALASSQTYCDMTTDGGGWTMVASIHESDIKKKCYPDDHWSFYRHPSTKNYPAKSNWENEMIFGNVQRSTTADFKHAGFFSMNASDIMIWHVPNGATTSVWKEWAILRYRTNNKILQSNGGSIGTLYKSKFPLTVTSGQEFTSIVLDALSSKGDDIIEIFPNFYNYAYGHNFIPDSNMYRSPYYGNRVSFNSWWGCSFYEVAYGTNNKCERSDSNFGTKKSRPFFAVVAILNTFKKTSYYRIELRSYRPYIYAKDGTILRNATVTKENLKLQYEMVQYRNSTYVTIGEFYFVVSNSKDWGSVEPTTFYRSYYYNRNYDRRNQYHIDGSPVNIVFGYTLLAISSGGAITQEQANKVGEEILNAIAPLKTLFRDSGPTGLFTPIVYDKGSNEEVMTMVPPTIRPFVQPGFIQFRAYNATGYPSAFCPGIKVFSIYPEYACIGSVSSFAGDHGTCGDFAGWEGMSTDVVQTSYASGLAHSHKDIFSTIFIFQR